MKNNFIRKIIFSTRKVLLPPAHDREESALYLKELIESGTPLMVARFGAVEIKALLYIILPPPICLIFRKWAYRDMYINAGFFPVNKKTLKRFADLVLECLKQVDILASWRVEEVFFRKRLRKSYKAVQRFLGVEYTPPFWSGALKDKKVLVIHPFAESIRSQYEKNRLHIFGDLSDEILPLFKKLETIKAVQSIAGNTEGFNDWFEALDYMKKEIDKKDFDIALLGCGAYGMPLAAYVKSIGKQAVYVGGQLQLYFGIKGKRWNKNMYNEYWISPSKNETPKNHTAVEGGCYW